jgi:putative zinc finger protein
MDCREYLENYLAAHADGELSSAELIAAEKHLEECDRCPAMLADERALKTLLRERLQKVAAPAQLRAAIRATLDRADAERDDSAASPDRAYPDRAYDDRARKIAPRRSRARWAGLAALAATVVIALLVRGWRNGHQPPTDLDVAIQEFNTTEQHFEPDPSTGTYGGVAADYHSAKVPDFIWNFEPVGYHLVGGHVGTLPDGRAASFTLYRGPDGAIMCMRVQVPNVTIPPGGHQMAPDRYYYNHQGYSVVLTVEPAPHWLCFLVSRMPEEQFEKDINLLGG